MTDSDSSSIPENDWVAGHENGEIYITFCFKIFYAKLKGFSDYFLHTREFFNFIIST